MHALFASPTFRRLWLLGGIVNAMRWVEMLAAGLFTFELTRSGVAVAAVLAVRSLPLLALGPLAGLVCDAWDRKRVVFWGLSLNAASAATISLLGLLGAARPWQIGIAAFLSGTVWATEMAGRRRMIGECAGAGLVSRAIAVDSLTNSLARIIGPLLGSSAYALLGLGGAFAISAATYLAGTLLVRGIAHRQHTTKLQPGRLPSELSQAFAYALGNRTVLAVLLATAAMNLFAFSYTAIVPLLALVGFGVGDALAGVLATGEPIGAFFGGVILARWTPPFNPLAMLLGGAAAFMCGLSLMAVMPGYGPACLALVLGGLGLALFNNMQTTLVLTEVPAAIRSRQMGLITAAMGAAPLGQIVIGVLADAFGPLLAVMVCALTGLAALAAIASLTARVSARALSDQTEPFGRK